MKELTYIKWADSHYLPGWVDDDERPDIDIKICESVGWVVEESTVALCIAATTNAEAACCVMTIPTSAILERCPVRRDNK